MTFEVVVLSMNQQTCATKSKHIIKIIEKEKESILEKKMIQWTNVVRIQAGMEITSAKSLSVSSFAAQIMLINVS